MSEAPKITMPEPFEVLELWGQNVNVYTAAQLIAAYLAGMEAAAQIAESTIVAEYEGVENTRFRAALDRIAAKKPYRAANGMLRCGHCRHAWVEGEPERHSDGCSLLIARTALNASVSPFSQQHKRDKRGAG